DFLLAGMLEKIHRVTPSRDCSRRAFRKKVGTRERGSDRYAFRRSRLPIGGGEKLSRTSRHEMPREADVRSGGREYASSTEQDVFELAASGGNREEGATHEP